MRKALNNGYPRYPKGVRLVGGLFGLLFVAMVTSSTSSAGPLAVTCVRDMEHDPAQIRALFGLVDRLAVRDLNNGHVYFYLGDRGFIPIDEFVLLMNFRDGREDASPLQVSKIQRLQFAGKPRHDSSYVVETTRSAWFDRGSDAHSSFTDLNETWLVSFSGCKVRTVRELPELHYLLGSQ